MRFLRTASTKRLAAVIASVLVIAVLGTTIALAAAGDGPKPPPKPLSNAVHDALASPEVPGITARVEFKNKLIDSSNFTGSNPILTGATGRLWLAPGKGVRLELQSENGDVQIVANKQSKSAWAYDSESNTVYKADIPEHHGKGHDGEEHGVPSVARIERKLDKANGHADISGAVPSDVANQPAYTVRVSPKRHPGLLGAGELAWDAARGVPLKVAVYAKGEADPVLELSATDVSYEPVATSNFDISPPADAKVVEIAPRDKQGEGEGDHGDHKRVTGVDAVGDAVDFKLAAPDTLAGMPRSEVNLVDWKKSPAALVTYGEGLDGIAVIEQDAKQLKRLEDKAKAEATDEGDDWTEEDRDQLELPTTDINGVDGTKLETALGTGVRFERDGVVYTVLGSVPADTAVDAARGL